MSKIGYLLISLCLLISCIGKHTSDAQKVVIGTQISSKDQLLALDTLNIDLGKSKLYWRGTKMRGAGKHEGEIQLTSAYILHKEGQLKGGEFRADMTTIGVTDIPSDDPIPIKNINKHLKSEDFFDVEKYPTSTFSITEIKGISPDTLEVSGNLTLKGITKNIRFIASNQDSLFSTTFTFDRFHWNIAYEGNWTDKTLVDKEVELRIKLISQL